MKIRIKELFKSDLDPNSNEWWSKDKIDKINFNFRLFRNGGPQGPIGIEGPNGNEGHKGITGDEGNQGPFGNQGVMGPPSEGAWKSAIVNNTSIIYPSFPSYNNNGFAISGMTLPVIGTNSHLDADGNLLSKFYGNTVEAPISLAGRGSLNIITEGASSIPSYNNLSDLNSILFIEDKDNINAFNFGLSSFETSPGSGDYTADFNIKPSSLSSNSSHSFEIDFQGDITFDFNTYPQFADNVLGQNSEIKYPLSVNASATGQFIEFTVGQLKFNNGGPSVNNVLVSGDNVGTVTWENVATMFSVLPIGSIIRIPSTEFNSTNFYTDNATTVYNGLVVGGGGIPDLRTNFGAGRFDGMFGGWYLCNGQKWGDGGIIIYDSPNLNGFSYQFSNIQSEDFGNSPSIGATGDYSGDILYGGSSAEIQLTGTEITQTTTSADESKQLDNIESTGHEKHIVFGEQISIIFLGDYTYTWSNHDPNVNTTDLDCSYHQLVGSDDQDGNDISLQYASSLADETRQWNAELNGTDEYVFWADDSNFSNSSIRMYENGSELETGWVVAAGIARYYEIGTGFTSQSENEVTHQCWMLYGDSVNSVDGTNDSLFDNPPATIPEESTISNNNVLQLQEMYVSNDFNNNQNVSSSTSDFSDYESTSHIWSVNTGSNSIITPTTGWYRSIPYTDSYTVSILGNFGGSLTIPAGYTSAYRKYWNQSDNSFKGDIIKDNYVPYSIGKFNLKAGANSQTIACDGSTGYDIFFSRDAIAGSVAGHTSTYSVENFSNSEGSSNNGTSWLFDTIYVREDASPGTSGGSNANLGKYPLRKIKSDTFIPTGGGQSSNLVIKLNSNSTFKEINSASMAPGTAQTCTAIPLPSAYTFNFNNTSDTGTLSGAGSKTEQFTWDGPNLDSSDFTATISNNLGIAVITNVTNTTNGGSVTFSYLPDAPGSFSGNVSLSFFGYTITTASTNTQIEYTYNPCHVEGTLISMSGGRSKAVEDLEIGDMLSSYSIDGLSKDGEWRNFKSNSTSFNKEKTSVKLTRIIKGTHTSYRNINNGLTKITGEHPVLTKKNDIIEFKRAMDIEIGEFIYVNENWLIVNSNEYVKETVNTYSIDVEEEDVYIADGILCHNIEEQKIE